MLRRGSSKKDATLQGQKSRLSPYSAYLTFQSADGKKKLSKAERLRLQREEEERRLLEEEQARLRAEQEEAIRLEKERIEREKTERLEAKDQERRGIELAELHVLEENFLTASRWKVKARSLAKWDHYTSCDGSPDPTVPREINTFMSLWQEEKNDTIQTVIAKSNRVLELIEKLQFYILDTPYHEISAEEVAQYQETILKLQTLLHHKFSEATEQLLKQASSYAESESGNMEVVIKEKNITLCIWANLKKNPRFRNQVFYDEKKEPCYGFELPKPLAVCDVAVRILHTHYDHVSPILTFPNEPPKLDLSAVKPVSSLEKKGQKIQKPSEESGLGSVTEPTTDRPRISVTPSSHEMKSIVHETESSEGSSRRSSFMLESVSRVHIASLQSVKEDELPPLEEYVVDLHQFMPVGGVYHFEAVKLPPQAKQVKGWTMVEVIQSLKATMHFTGQTGGSSCGPPAPWFGHGRNKEAEHTVLWLPDLWWGGGPWKSQPQCDMFSVLGQKLLDTGLESCPYTAMCEEGEDPFLMTVGLTIQLLDKVMYFEEPLIARWDPEGKCWRTDGIGDVVYNMKEREISFKMNGFFVVTLLQDTHISMPYQFWELRPRSTNEAIFCILTTFTEVEIHIKGNQCMLESVRTVDDFLHLSELKGVWMTPLSLALTLKQAGLNIFPAEYSPKYVSINRKTLLAEITAYQQMALVASAFAFSWSKWNLHSGEENVVFKACEHLGQEEVSDGSWALYMFNGQRAQRLEISEESETFSKNIAEDTEFHSTLYHLIRDAGSDAGMERVNHTDCLFVDVVHQLLLATRVLTYS
ncbi:dynein axonemal intermediate chain 7 [Varanus komodoensis]|uniref:dynein axonemal intermediate chain 7 n=1 Tax=Varanus komodoensis TaxID=61221 RepID=UPI001CF7960B|nr:dynein axonemal intermediate chain 7 [Varanus komodoensis]